MQQASERSTAHRSPRLNRYSELGVVVTAGLAMILYTYFTPPLIDKGLLNSLPVVAELPGDFPGYAVRFVAAFLLLGLLPLLAGLILGRRPADLGLRRPGGGVRPLVYVLLAAVLLAAGVAAAYTPSLYAYYPYSQTLLERVASGEAGLFLVHALLYLLAYYLPWEFFFRGFLLFPFLRLVENSSGGKESAALLAVASLQAIPSALLHFHHPFIEVLMALPFGMVLGWLAWRTRSVFPGLLLHYTVGLSMDLFIILRVGRILP
jgi:membrane protease YdiL (CAAX protease family)